MRARGWPIPVVAALGLTGALILTVPTPPPAAGQPPEAGVPSEAARPDPRPDDAFADPAVAELQRKATDAQRELTDAQTEVRKAEAELDSARADVAEATAARRRADAEVDALRGDVDLLATTAFAGGRPAALGVLLTADSADDYLDGVALLAEVRADLDRRLDRVLRARRSAVAAERAAANAERAATARQTELAGVVDETRERAAGIATEMGGVLAELNDVVVTAQQAQQVLNQRTAANWQDYLDRLDGAGITPPPADRLRDQSRLPAGLRPLPGTGGNPQPGIAQTATADGDRLLVLPAETVEALTLAMAALGRPYAPGKAGRGPDAYSCGGLVSRVFTRAGLPLTGSPARLLSDTEPVPAADIQPGDLVFVGPLEHGVQHVGIALDKGVMLAADARQGTVAVTGLPAGDALLGVTRPAAGGGQPDGSVASVTEATEVGVPIRRCNGVVVPAPRPGADMRGAGGAWGGFPNGMIPTAALCPTGTGEHRLRCDAAMAYRAMAEAFGGRFGRQLCLGGSYRTYDEQVRLYAAKPALAAVPGTSNHGWGLAVDLCGGAASFGTAEYRWLTANGPKYGWVNPPWAQPGRGREEPWHWEFVG